MAAAFAAAAEGLTGVRQRQHGAAAAHPLIGGRARHSGGAASAALQEQVRLSPGTRGPDGLRGASAALQLQSLAAQAAAGAASGQSAGGRAAAGAGLPPCLGPLEPPVRVMVMRVFADIQVGPHGLDHFLKVMDFPAGFFQG